MEEVIIKKPMRTAIKNMAKVAHVANAVSQMPSPNDFALMITGDIVYMSAKIQKVVSSMNSLLDVYSNIPMDFLNDSLYSLVDTTTGLINKVDNYYRSNVNSVFSVAENTTKLSKELVNTSINMYAQTSSAVMSLTKNIDMTSSIISIKGDEDDIKEKLDNAINDIRTQTKESKENALKSIKYVENKISDAKKEVLGIVSDKTKNINDNILGFQNNVQELLNKIKISINDFSNSIDNLFGVSLYDKQNSLDTLGVVSTVSNDQSTDAMDKLASTAVGEIAKISGGIIKNFSIGKFVTACAGMTTNILLVESGLNKLPSIDANKIIDEINGVEQKLFNSGIEIDDLVQYNPSKFNKYKDRFEEELQIQRNAIRKKMANKNKKYSLINELNVEKNAGKNFKNRLSEKERKEIKSAIKEIRKQRRSARKAKKTNKLKDVILRELRTFYEEVKKLMKTIKTKWDGMMNNYRNSVEEIRHYFLEGGDGDDTIERICDDIDLNCVNIKKLCTQDLPVQLTYVSINVAMPRAIGTCFPNFAQHIVQFFADVKIIIKFIMDLIRYVKNIMNDVNSLIKIIRNGVNNAGKIYKQLMDILSLSWLTNLVKKIQSKFNSAMATTVELLENTVEPIYFEDTEDYESMMDAVDALIDQELPEGCLSVKSLYNTIYSYVAGNGKLTDGLSDVFSSKLANKIYNGSADDDDIEKLTDKLDDMGSTIVAYRSPLFKKDSNGKIINYNEGSDELFEPKLEGYIYYHPDLYHYSTSSFGIFGKMRRRRKSRFIKKAARKSGKISGGVNMIKKNSKLFYNRSEHSNVSAWDAFYWYKVLTDNFDVDFPGTDNTERIISKVVFNTSSGSVVLIDLGNGNTQKVFVKDANVKSGDYVNYNGQRYKIM